jgi:AcrR family transcriptional regulator
MPGEVKSLRVEHAEATRAALLDAAIAIFTRDGYEPASLDRIAAAARVSKGAVYHHFANKRGLFKAVYRHLATVLHDRVQEAVAGTEPGYPRVERGLSAFLAQATDEPLRRVVFLQGPAVLSGECRQIDEEVFLGFLERMLRELSDAGVSPAGDPELVASLMLGVLIEASQLIGRARDVEHTRSELAVLLPRMLLSLLAAR